MRLAADWESGGSGRFRDGAAQRVGRIAPSIGYADVEISFKLGPGRLVAGRALYGIDKSRLSLGGLLAVADQMGIPDVYRAELRNGYDAANFLYLGFEEDDTVSCAKIYLEFPVFIGIAPGSAGQGGRPALMYLGFKWDAVHRNPVAVTRYVWRVHLPRTGIRSVIAGIGEAGADNAAACALALVDECAASISDRDLVLLEVAEPGLPRRSFDVRLYASECPVGAGRGPIAAAALRFGLPSEVVSAVLESVEDCALGHVGGGIDRKGREFLTIHCQKQGIKDGSPPSLA